MYALKVSLNDEQTVIAGADDLAVLNTIISCVGKLGPGTAPVRENDAVDLSLTVSGLTRRNPETPDEHLNWLSNAPLKTGDVVRIELIEVPQADAPIRGHEAEKRKHDEREFFEHCKKVYLELREQYEEPSA